MSVTVMGADLSAPSQISPLRRVIAGPRQGWLAVLLVGVMLAVVGLALDDTGWVLNRAGQSATSWLPAAMVAAGAVGFLFGISRSSTAGSHLFAAAIGTAVILIASAGAVSDAATLLAQLRDLSNSFSDFVNDVFVLQTRSYQPAAPLILVAAIAWTTGYFASFNVFRRNRGMAAVLSGGIVLLLNMAITERAQYGYLIVFTLASMLLLVRLNIVEQSVGWQRRHIGNAENVSSLFLRGGAVFVTITLLGAIFLAATASSAPLAGIWRNASDPLMSVTETINRFVGGIAGSTRNLGGAFGSTATIRGFWQPSNEPVFTTTTNDPNQYWRAETFEEFDGVMWIARGGASQDVPENAQIGADTSDRELTSGPGRREVVATITSIALPDSTMLAPDTVLAADVPTRLTTAGEGGPIEKIDVQAPLDAGAQYTVTSMVPVLTGRGGLTANMLASAGVEYPQWVRDRYLSIIQGSIGPQAAQIAGQIQRRLPAGERDPYHVAHAVQDYFARDGGYHYNINVRDLCGATGPVDCLLIIKQGYCEYFASAMTMMLRTLDIPARFVEGYLPGTPMADRHTYLVTKSALHAWVEVYFPGYGWIRFDPTPGNTQNGREATDLPDGPPVVASSSPDASIGEGATSPLPSPESSAEPNSAVVPPPGPSDPGAIGLYAVMALVVVAVVIAVLVRRRRRSGLSGDQTFERVARLAARLGYAPRPSQTAYEYVGSLGEIVPVLKPELHLVATAKVEATYGRRDSTKTSLTQVHAAYARIRRRLLMLFFHPRRPKQPHG